MTNILKILIIFIFSFDTYSSCFKSIEKTEVERSFSSIVLKECFSSRSIRKNKKDTMCDCQLENEKFNFSDGQKYKQVSKDIERKFMDSAIEAIRKNMMIVMNDLYSLDEYASGQDLGQCKLKEFEKIEKECNVTGNKLNSLYKDSPVQTLIDDMKSEFKIRSDRTKVHSQNRGLVDRSVVGLQKKCSISDNDAVSISSMREKNIMSLLTEEVDLKGDSLSDYLGANPKLFKHFVDQGLDLDRVMNETSFHPHISSQKRSEPMVSFDKSVSESVKKLKQTCSDTLAKLRKVSCLDNSSSLTGSSSSVYKDKFKVNKNQFKEKKIDEIDKVWSDQIVGTHMCRSYIDQNSIDITESNIALTSTLSEVYKEGSLNLNDIKKNLYKQNVVTPVNNICKYLPEIAEGMERENCSKKPLSLVCLDLAVYKQKFMQPKEIAKVDNNGEVLLDSAGDVIMVSNPSYISLNDIDAISLQKEGLVNSFFDAGSDISAEKEKNTEHKISKDNNPGTFAKRTKIENRTTSINAPRSMRESTSQDVKSSNSVNRDVEFVSNASKTIKDISKIQNNMNDLYKDLARRITSSKKIKGPKKVSRSSGSTSQPRPMSTIPSGFSAVATNDSSEEDAFVNDDSSVENNDAQTSQVNRTPASSPKNTNRGVASSLSGQKPYDRIDPETGKFNNGIEISTSASPLGDIPEVELYGNIEDDLLSLDPAKMVNLDKSQKKSLNKLKELVKSKKPFYISKRGDKRYRVLLISDNGKYKIDRKTSLRNNRDALNFDENEYDTFIQNIENSLDKDIFEMLEGKVFEKK